MEFYRTDPIYMYTTISKNLPTIPIPRSKFMLGSETELAGRFWLFSSVRYCVLPGAVCCGAVHTFSHTQPQVLRLILRLSLLIRFRVFRVHAHAFS